LHAYHASAGQFDELPVSQQVESSGCLSAGDSDGADFTGCDFGSLNVIIAEKEFFISFDFNSVAVENDVGPTWIEAVFLFMHGGVEVGAVVDEYTC
jgi:hypothetical protein